MPRLAAPRMNSGKLFMIAIVAIMFVYLWGQFTEEVECTSTLVAQEVCDADELGTMITQFKMPTNVDEMTLWILKLLIIGTAVYLAYAVVMKVSGASLSKRDVASLIVLGVVVFLVWEYIAQDVLNATTLADISFKTLAKAGLLK